MGIGTRIAQMTFIIELFFGKNLYILTKLLLCFMCPSIRIVKQYSALKVKTLEVQLWNSEGP